MKAVQFIQTTPEELQIQISEVIKDEMAKFFSKYHQKEAEEYLTRQEVANRFKVNLSTVHLWVKNGKLKPYGIGGRVYFLKSEIDNSLVPLT